MQTMIPSKYKITKSEDDYIKPEETLADSLSRHPMMEIPIGRGIFNFFYAGIAVILIFFIFKSFRMQIIDGRDFAVVAERSASPGYPLSSLRGIIYDSAGNPLVENVPVFNLVAIHARLPAGSDQLQREINELSSVIGIDEQTLTQLFDANKNRASLVIQKNLMKDEIIKINSLFLPGIYVAANSQRHYIDGQAAAHLLGYTTMVTPDDLKRDAYYYPLDRKGSSGLEAEYEDTLRGEHRKIDLSGKNAGTDGDSAIPGNNLYLNVNEELQRRLYKSIISVFNSAGVKRGAAIVQNPKTGEILGLISLPSFDNNIFENSADEANSLKVSQVLNGNDKPLLNRVIGGRYSPGSTIKPLLALAGLKENIITPSTTVMANGSISVQSEVDPNVFYIFRDWRVHGLTDLKKAIADSVDVYFYALGGGYGNIKGLGIDKISGYLRNFLADKPTQIDLPGETTGLVPSKEWKEDVKGEAWYVGDTYNISIGQGDLVVTPAWLNTYVGSIANGGKLMKPFIVKEIKDPAGNTLARFSPQVLGEIPFDQKIIDLVKQGMRQAVLSGTATLLQDIPVPVAAKTGTAQITGKALNSLFTVFGPVDDPEISMTVLVENINQSQGLAIRVANDFLMWYFGQSKLKTTTGRQN